MSRNTTGYYEITAHNILNSDPAYEQGFKVIAGNIIHNHMHWHDSLELIYRLSAYKAPLETDSRKSKGYERFIRCMDYIHNHYDDELSAAILAREIHVSEPTVYRLFHSKMGMNLNSYINTVRISAACGMLREGSRNTSEIAADCGYRSLSNFYRAFEDQMGCSPKAYKSRLKKPENHNPVEKGLAEYMASSRGRDTSSRDDFHEMNEYRILFNVENWLTIFD